MLKTVALLVGLALAPVMTGCVSGSDSSPESQTGVAQDTMLHPVTATTSPLPDSGQLAGLTQDLEAMSSLMNESPVQWDHVRQVYVNGSLPGEAASLQAIATRADLPNELGDWSKVFEASALNTHILDAIENSGRAAGLSDEARRELVERGTLTIFNALVLQLLDEARQHMDAEHSDSADSATRYVGDALATYEGGSDLTTDRPLTLSSWALKVSAPIDPAIRGAFVALQKAAEDDNKKAFKKEALVVRSQLSAIYYRDLQIVLEETVENDSQQVLLARAWATWQGIRPQLYAVSSRSAVGIEQALARNSISPDEVAFIQKLLGSDTIVNGLDLPEEQYPD